MRMQVEMYVKVPMGSGDYGGSSKQVYSGGVFGPVDLLKEKYDAEDMKVYFVEDGAHRLVYESNPGSVF